MSYCRWSSDDFKSDLYVYAHVDETWTIHVAGNRIVGTCPPQAWPTDPKDPVQLEAFRASYDARRAFMDGVEHVPIGLPHDCETFKLASPGECADKCEALAAMGYFVPAYVVPALREEQAEIAAAPEPTTPAQGEAPSGARLTGVARSENPIPPGER